MIIWILKTFFSSELLEIAFEKAFKYYEHPFTKSNDKIMRMNEAQRNGYYNQAINLVENPVYRQELDETIRTFYAELALKTVSKLEQEGYRQALKALQHFDSRIVSLAAQYCSPDNTKPIHLD